MSWKVRPIRSDARLHLKVRDNDVSNHTRNDYHVPPRTQCTLAREPPDRGERNITVFFTVSQRIVLLSADEIRQRRAQFPVEREVNPGIDATRETVQQTQNGESGSCDLRFIEELTSGKTNRSRIKIDQIGRSS